MPLYPLSHGVHEPDAAAVEYEANGHVVQLREPATENWPAAHAPEHVAVVAFDELPK